MSYISYLNCFQFCISVLYIAGFLTLQNLMMTLLPVHPRQCPRHVVTVQPSSCRHHPDVQNSKVGIHLPVLNKIEIEKDVSLLQSSEIYLNILCVWEWDCRTLTLIVHIPQQHTLVPQQVAKNSPLGDHWLPQFHWQWPGTWKECWARAAQNCRILIDNL